MKRLVFLLLCLTFLCACNSSHSPSITPPFTGTVNVKTDYSAYEPRTLPTKYSRLRLETIYDLQPSDNYGGIYPFAAVPQYAKYPSGFLNKEGYFYGMVTRDGCIVADPVYSDVRRLSLPYWVLEKRGEPRAEGYGSDDRYALASLDGSFVTECIYHKIYDCGNRILAVRELSPFRFDLLDENANVILSSEDLPEAERLRSGYRIDYSDGRLLLAYSAGENLEYYYADETGKRLLGPYLDAEAFLEGMAYVQLTDGTYTFIDLQGKTVGRSFISDSAYFEDGVAVVETEETTEVIDRSGKPILSFPSHTVYIWRQHEGYLFVNYYDSKRSDIYKADGTLIYDNAAHPEMESLYNSFLYEDKSASQPYLLDVRTNKRYDIPSENYSHCFSGGSVQTPFVFIAYGERYNWSYRILNAQFEQIAVDVTDYMWIDGYLAVRKDGIYHIYNEENEFVGECPVARIETASAFEDGVFAVTDEFAAYLYDENFELLFCYPLLTAMED